MLLNSSVALNDCQTGFTFVMCLMCTTGLEVFAAFTVTNTIVILPLSVLIIYIGLQQWRQQRTNARVAATSPSDHFTFHIVGIETISLIGDISYCIGNYSNNTQLVLGGFFLLCIVIPGQDLFHCLTCMERYLAVLHPITYLHLKRTSGVWITNICIACVWFMCGVWVLIAHMQMPFYPLIPFSVWFGLSLFFSFFCSLSVLRTLTRPGPGDGDRNRVDRSKRRAFHTITAITATLLIRCVGFLMCFFSFGYFSYNDIRACMAIKLVFWFCLPSSLVLPLLFLQRTRQPARH
ncbi:hypothetical protein JOB18_044841 [Solea senegalensis]|uniref:Taste receptor type 2 n=1 Tax=Solea senegalensis TaxID=28829 RepID=A0AAV6QF63_SOLSE|nr:hypothetical protein JOB18_044841 [Solea senegalensis]